MAFFDREVDMRTTIWQISIIAATLATLANRANAQAPGADKIAARVNDEVITQVEFQNVIESRPSPVPVSKELQVELRKAAIEMLIDDMLVRQFLRKTVTPASPADIQKEYDKLNEALTKQKKTMEQFLQEGKMTAEQLRADIIARLQWKSYLATRFPEAEIKSYYDANKVFFDNIVVRASHILVKVNANAPADEKQKAKAKLETIRQEIVAGKISFEDAARKYSDCPSRDKGGDIGNFPYKFVVVEPFARAAFGTEKGKMTEIITTDFGFHLIKVTDRSAGEPSRFEEIREVIRDVMAQEQELQQRILAEQKKTAKIEVMVQ
jgi:parvulin-like peptidyl-prolyl isomerase